MNVIKDDPSEIDKSFTFWSDGVDDDGTRSRRSTRQIPAEGRVSLGEVLSVIPWTPAHRFAMPLPLRIQ